MLGLDLTGKRALVAGVADGEGFGFAIAKALAEAGAIVSVGTWPPALSLFRTLLERKMDEALTMANGERLAFERIYPLDVDFDTWDHVPQQIMDSRRYRDAGDFTIEGVAEAVVKDLGRGALDIVVHSIANGPEVKKPLMATSRAGYMAALSASSYSLVSMVRTFAPIMRRGGAFLSLSYLAADRVIPGYGGGMSAAKAALQSDTRTLAFEAGRQYGHRVNCISAGPYPSRAASAVGALAGIIDYVGKNAPLPGALTAREVGCAAAFLCSPLASGITGEVVHVDRGFSTMGMSIDT